LRQDNADSRLTPIGREVGLVSDAQWEYFNNRQEAIAKEKERLSGVIIKQGKEVNAVLTECGTSPISTPVSLAELIKRPQLNLEVLAKFDTYRPILPQNVVFTAQTDIKYDGYVKKQLAEVERAKKLEEKPLPQDLDYSTIKGLRIEAVQKLNKVKPLTLGQASRISGVSPADISVLIIYLEK
jgi:tRNA uridine 5-carboxymethylaminomethyl modification enzyme